MTTQLYPYPKYMTLDQYLTILDKSVKEFYENNSDSTRLHHVGDLSATVATLVEMIGYVITATASDQDGN